MYTPWLWRFIPQNNRGFSCVVTNTYMRYHHHMSIGNKCCEKIHTFSLTLTLDLSTLKSIGSFANQLYHICEVSKHCCTSNNQKLERDPPWVIGNIWDVYCKDKRVRKWCNIQTSNLTLTYVLLILKSGRVLFESLAKHVWSIVVVIVEVL